MNFLRLLCVLLAVSALQIYPDDAEWYAWPRLISLVLAVAALVLAEWIGDREEKQGRGW